MNLTIIACVCVSCYNLLALLCLNLGTNAREVSEQLKEMSSPDPGLYHNQAVCFKCMGMLRPGFGGGLQQRLTQTTSALTYYYGTYLTLKSRWKIKS